MKTVYYFCLAFLLGVPVASAQIPNASFETWIAGEPEGWVTTNFVGIDSPVTQSSTAIDGQSSLRGEVLSIFGQPLPPMAATGRMTSPDNVILGFPYTGRPDALNGYLSTSLSGLDTANIIAVFRSGGDSIGVGFFRTGNDIANLTAFSAPIYWFDNRTPDTAYVLMVIDGEPVPTAGSSFIVDALSFGSALGVDKDVTSDALRAISIPGGYEFRIANTEAVPTKLDIIDMHGRVAETLCDEIAHQTRIRWYGGSLSNGIYIARLTSANSFVHRKVVLTR